MLQKPDPSDWLMWRRTLDSWGYSPLKQIDRTNVGKLKMIWMRGMGPGIQEATPLVYHGMMYLPNPSDLVQAINAATGDLIWEYKRKLPDDVNKHLPVPSINRNIAIYNNLIIDTSVDDFVYALDAQTGKLAYENRIVDYREDSAQETSGPIIADGKTRSADSVLRIELETSFPCTPFPCAGRVPPQPAINSSRWVPVFSSE